MQDNTELKISEAKYVRSNHSKHNEKKRVHKTQRIVSTVVVVLCFAFLVFSGARVVSANTAAFQIVVDGEGLATLPTEKEAKAAIARYLEEQSELMGIDAVCGDTVKVERVSSREAVYSSTKEAVTSLNEGVKVLAKAVAVCVNGQPVMFVPNEETARNALEQAKSYYGQVGEGGIEKINVLEEVAAISSNIEPEKIFSSEEAANMLLFGNTNAQYHFVETEGETFDYIANRYSIKVDDIKTANPAVDSTNMAVGEAILLNRVNPLISVQVKRVIVSREETSFETEQRDNYDMPRGEINIVVEGAPGEDEITTEIIERNGMVMAQSRVSTVTLVEPETRVVDRGAKMVIASRNNYTAYLGNGEFGWPVNGEISSRFGARSLGWHSGLDIEGAVGTPISASEAGIVVFAAYDGSYGNCVRIDHGNDKITYYAHMQAFAVSVGEMVKRGQMVGTIGMTGRTTGPHVHFEVRVQGAIQNPLQYLEPR